MKKSKQIKLGAIISYIAIIVNICVGFLYTPWLVNHIGQSDYGLYTLALSVINFFLLDFGMSAAVSKFIAEYRANSQEEKIKDLLGIVTKIYLILDCLIAVVLCVIYCFISNIFVKLTPDEIIKFKTIFVMVGCYSFVSFPLMPLNGIYSAYEQFVPLKFFEIVGKFVNILSVVVVLLCGGGLYSLVFVNIASQIFVKIIQLSFITRREKISISFKNTDKKFVWQIMGFSLWMTIMSISQRLIININPSIIGAVAGAIEVSIFSIATSLEGYTWTFANALNGLFLPKVTRLSVREENLDKINELLIKVGRIQLIVVGLIIGILFSMGKEFIVLWMGEIFRKSYYVAIFLITPGVVTLTQEIAMNYLVALNEVKWRAIDYAGTACISLLLSLFLTPKYGAVGAAFAVFIGLLLGHVILMNIIYYKKFSLDIPRFFKECHLKLLPVLLIMVIIGFLMQNLFPSPNLLLFFVKAVVWCCLYVLLMIVFGLNDHEKNLIKEIINKIKWR